MYVRSPNLASKLCTAIPAAPDFRGPIAGSLGALTALAEPAATASVAPNWTETDMARDSKFPADQEPTKAEETPPERDFGDSAGFGSGGSSLDRHDVGY